MRTTLAAAFLVTTISCGTPETSPVTPEATADRESSTATESGTSDGPESPDQQIRAIVRDLGQRLRNVSVLGPPETIGTSIRREYGELVTSQLLQEWLNDPGNSPGRLTSSPWPAR